MHSIVLSLVVVSSVSAQASSLVGTKQGLATVLSRNLAPAVDILRCFAVTEHQIGEHIHELLTGQTLALTSPAKHRFEFKLTDDGLQQRFASDDLGQWHAVDSAAYRTLLAVAPEQRWQVFDAVQSLIVGTSTTPELEVASVGAVTNAQLIVDDVKLAVDKLHRHDHLKIIDGIGMTGNLANFLKQPKNRTIADSFYQFLTTLIGNVHAGLRGKQALMGIDNTAVSTDQRQAIYASELNIGIFIYLAIDSSDQPELIIISSLHKVPNPHNSSLIGMARKATSSWHDSHAKRLEHHYPELIETGKTSPAPDNLDTEVQSSEILLRTFEMIRNLVSDPQLATLEKLLTESTHTESKHLSSDALIDRYVDLIAELYAVLFNGAEHDYAKLITETEDLFEATIDDRIVAIDDYSAMINSLQIQPHRAVNNRAYARDLSHIHYHKTKELLNTRLIDDLTQTAQLLEANDPALTRPKVVATLTSMEVSTDNRQALAGLLHDWASKFTRAKYLHVDLREQFNNYVNNELQLRQPALDALKVKLIAQQEGWTVLGNDKKIIVTSQFADFYQRNEQHIANFNLPQVVRGAASLTGGVFEKIQDIGENHVYTQEHDIADITKMKKFIELLGNPYEVKLVGSSYIENAGGSLVLNGIKNHYDVPHDARPVYQLSYRTYRIYAQVIQLDNRLYLALLSGFHKEEKRKISYLIRWMQKSRQSKAIIDAINILAKLDNSAEQQVAEFELEYSARQLYYGQ